MIIGGYDPHHIASKKSISFNIEDQKSSLHGTLIVGRGFPGVMLINSILYVFGGCKDYSRGNISSVEKHSMQPNNSFTIITISNQHLICNNSFFTLHFKNEILIFHFSTTDILKFNPDKLEFTSTDYKLKSNNSLYYCTQEIVDGENYYLIVRDGITCFNAEDAQHSTKLGYLKIGGDVYY